MNSVGKVNLNPGLGVAGFEQPGPGNEVVPLEACYVRGSSCTNCSAGISRRHSRTWACLDSHIGIGGDHVGLVVL